MRKWMKLASVAVFTASVACFSLAVSTTNTIVNTGFTAAQGYTDNTDLAGQNGWRAMPNTATNAFNIADASGSGYASTVGTMVSVTNGNYVFYTNRFTSAKSNELSGSLDFSLDSTMDSIGGFDFLHIGMSTSTNGELRSDDLQDVYFSLATQPSGAINVRVKEGDPIDGVATLLFSFPSTSVNFTAPAYTSDVLRLEWKIRKAAVNLATVYIMSASLTNLDMATPKVSGSVALTSKTTAYTNNIGYFVMGHPSSSYSSNIFATTEVVIDNLSVTNESEKFPTLFAPPVLVNALSKQVVLSWPVVSEAVTLDIYRSLGDTNGFATTPDGTNRPGTGLTYVDNNNVVNGNIYYYKVVWKYPGAVDGVSEIVMAEPNFERTGTIIDTSFTPTNYVTGDLAGQKRWKAITASASPAFYVDSAGNGYADTTPYSNFFNNVTGNQVYWNDIMSNSISAAWSGTTVFSLNATTETGLTRVETNVVGDVTNTASQAVALMDSLRVFEFGISSDILTTVLDSKSKSSDLLITVRTATDAGISVHLNGLSGTVNNMLEVPRESLGWDPEWAGFRTTNAPDFQTDPITLNWKIRKTPVTNVYSAAISLSVGTNSYTGNVEYTDDLLSQAPGLWTVAAPYVRFGVSHTFNSQTNSTNTMVNVAIDSLSLNHNYDEPMMYAAPNTLTALIGNTNITLKWLGAPEAATNAFEVWRSIGYGQTNSGDFTKVATLANNPFDVLGYTYTDYGLTNKVLYNYKIGAVYAGQTNFTDTLSVRARDKVTQQSWDAVGKVTGNRALNPTQKSSNGTVITYYGLYTNAIDGTNKALLYSTFTSGGTTGTGGPLEYDKAPNAATVYGFMQISATNGTPTGSVGSGAPDDWRMQIGNFQLQVQGGDTAGSTWSNLASSLMYIKLTNTVDVSAGEYAWDLDSVSSENVRPAVRNGGTWYVTDKLYSDSALIYVEDLKDPTNQWRELAFSLDTLMNGTNNPIATGLALTSVDAVGLFLDQSPGNFRPKLLRFSKVMTSLPTYTITTTLDGTPDAFISPSNPVVQLGVHQEFVISGGIDGTNLYRVLSLKTNGNDVAGLTFSNSSKTVNFTWYDVGGNGTVDVAFTNYLFSLRLSDGYLPDYGNATNGLFTNGTRVAIVASNPPPGKVFDKWFGNSTYIEGANTNPSCTVVMGLNGAKDLNLTAQYKDPTFTLTVSNGTGSATNLIAGLQVDIGANAADPGYVFDKWTGDTNALLSNVVFTTVLMPSADVLVIATYKLNEVTLTASAGSGGTISPTTTNVTPGANASFTITADSYYRIVQVQTNGANTGVAFDNTSTSYDYVWNDVQATGAVYASFTPQVTTNGPAPVTYSWLASYFTTNDYTACALADQDADGAKTWQEYIAGTIPTNKASVFAAAQATRNVVTWTPVTGRVYSVYWTTNLATKAFTNKQDNIVHPQGSYTNTTPDARVNQYQVKVRLQ